VPEPVSTTASQKPAAPHCAGMGGSVCPPGNGFADFAIPVLSVSDSPTASPSAADLCRHRPAARYVLTRCQDA
jgi:hypothetical protein